MGFLAFLLVLGVICLALSVVVGAYAFTRRDEPVANQVPLETLFDHEQVK